MPELTKSPTSRAVALIETSNVNAEGSLSQATPALPAVTGSEEVSKTVDRQIEAMVVSHNCFTPSRSIYFFRRNVVI